jgi:hypothetical protein
MRYYIARQVTSTTTVASTEHRGFLRTDQPYLLDCVPSQAEEASSSDIAMAHTWRRSSQQPADCIYHLIFDIMLAIAASRNSAEDTAHDTSFHT